MSELPERVAEMLEAAVEAGEGYDRAGLLHELARLPDAGAREVLTRLAKKKGAEAVPLLQGLATVATGPLALAVVEALSSIRDVAAASCLQVLAAGASGDLRKAVRRGLHRLASLGVHPSVAAAAPAEEQVRGWYLARALVSPFDGAGNRAMWLDFPRGSDAALLGLVWNEEKGILDVFTAEMARSRFDREAARLASDEDLPWVEVPVDYARHLIEEAHALNAASGTHLPFEYLVWRDRIGRPLQSYERPLVYSVINPAEVRWDPRYLERSAELLGLEMFRIWLLDQEALGPFVRERVAAEQSGLVLAAVSREAQERSLVDRAIQALFDARVRALFKRRLEETSYLLWKLGREDRARIAVAAALALEPPERSLQNHPFVRGLVEWNLEVAVASAVGKRSREVKPGVRLHLPY
ncbi:MAG: hypothetical protein ACM3US_04900 [Sphingomonadaceae bacterium]